MLGNGYWAKAQKVRESRCQCDWLGRRSNPVFSRALSALCDQRYDCISLCAVNRKIDLLEIFYKERTGNRLDRKFVKMDKDYRKDGYVSGAGLMN